ncbi:MAG: GatB/YqeY domain-containing protein [Defluviicoccus sp.]|nr:GatB/YqeY domain-containing protein [Defluviicoccus sp.]MDE0386237.1 GatB/YqeY domain-containing protein [Defluviicoccus sp.]
MLRKRLADRLKTGMKEKDACTVSTVRLILAAIKDRDIASRGRGEGEAIADQDILGVLQTMVRQREEAIALYRQGGRDELAQQEEEEIRVIESFLPQQMSDEETAGAVHALIAEIGADSIKDMGRTMALLKERYAGRMNFGRASAVVKSELTGR